MGIRALGVSALLLVGFLVVPAAQKDEVVYDEDVKVVSFEAAAIYPPIAESARVQGDVVVGVALNDDGSVKNAVALSGSKLLVSAAIDNAKKWKLAPNVQRRAVIVFEFRLPPTCANPFDVLHLVQLVRPNIASVCGRVPLASDGIVRTNPR
jgi:TonB family protein